MKISQEINHKRGIASCFGNIGIVYFYWGKFDLALENYKKYLNISKEIGNQRNVARAFSNIYFLYEQAGNYEEANKNLIESKRILDAIGAESDLIIFYIQKGNSLTREHKFDGAIELYNKALLLSEKIDDKHSMVSILTNIGYSFMAKGEYKKAEEYFLRSRIESKKLGADNSRTLAYGNLAILYKNMQKYEQSIENFQKAIIIAKKVNRMPMLGRFYIDQAEVLFLEKEYRKAKLSNLEGLKIVKELNMKKPIWVAELNNYKIDFFFSPEKKDICISSLKSLLENEADSERKAILNSELAKMYKEIQNFTSSKNHLKESLKIYRKIYQKIPVFKYKKEIEEIEKELKNFASKKT